MTFKDFQTQLGAGGSYSYLLRRQRSGRCRLKASPGNGLRDPILKILNTHTHTKKKAGGISRAPT
jgi:hypothetical protein